MGGGTHKIGLDQKSAQGWSDADTDETAQNNFENTTDMFYRNLAPLSFCTQQFVNMLPGYH